MPLAKPCCLILACGNTLREDDGVGPWLAEWAKSRFRTEQGVRVLARQQWTPELVEEIIQAQSVIFIDCATNFAPGEIHLAAVEPSAELPRLLTHQLSASELLALCREYYNSLPRCAMLLTVGAGSLELREGFSRPVQAILPEAANALERTVLHLLSVTADTDPADSA
ncbi:MAG: hydrogenase maturation protease [Terracidiphilus sp.]